MATPECSAITARGHLGRDGRGAPRPSAQGLLITRHGRLVEELMARVHRAGATGPLVQRADAGFFSYSLLDTLTRLGASWSMTVIINPRIRACIEAIDESAWPTIFYPDGREAPSG